MREKGKKQGQIGKISAIEVSQEVDPTLSPSQTTSQLASLADSFFSPMRFFSPFSPSVEPASRLALYNEMK